MEAGGWPKLKAGVPEVAEVGVAPKENAPAVAGLCGSSAGFEVCPKLKDVIMGAGAWPKPPNPFEAVASLLSLGAKGFEVAEEAPKLNEGAVLL